MNTTPQADHVAVLQRKLDGVREELAEFPNGDPRWRSAQTEVAEALTAAIEAIQRHGEPWISDRLPESLKPVLLCIRDGNFVTVLRACYAAPNTLELGWESESWEGCTEDEATETTYCPAGWYEWNRHEETHWHVIEEIIGWQPLPPAAGGASR